MSYAIETKKRKFERILESLTEKSTAPARPLPLTTHNNASIVSINPSSSTDSSKRRRIIPMSNAQRLANVSTASLTTHYLPSSRLAFLERLESFRQVTKWHVPSTSTINAVAWAKRGWVCQDTDTVSCPVCKERLHVDIDVEAHTQEPDMEERDEQNAEDNDPHSIEDAILQGLMQRYQDMIVTAHTDVCPWRRRGCDTSIQRIEGLLNVPTALSGFEERYQSIVEDATEVPEVMPLPSTQFSKINEQELTTLQPLQEESLRDMNTARLAVCGWQKKEKDIIECRHCFRSLGLWLYRGAEPTIEHLDAVDSHLEYCPWRSEVAQDIELSSVADQERSVKRKMAGWTLVYIAIVKKNNKGRLPVLRDPDHNPGNMGEEHVQSQVSPEQREKKMKDIMRRIRDLKKPFNVKALLKRKDKAQP